MHFYVEKEETEIPNRNQDSMGIHETCLQWLKKGVLMFLIEYPCFVISSRECSKLNSIP